MRICRTSDSRLQIVPDSQIDNKPPKLEGFPHSNKMITERTGPLPITPLYCIMSPDIAQAGSLKDATMIVMNGVARGCSK
jgi:hypothetical protein